MSLWRRLRRLFDAKAHAALDRAEDPVEALEVAYRTQVAALEEARRGIADVLTSEKRLELEVRGFDAASERATAQAAAAVRAGDDDGARRALEREGFITRQRGRLLSEIDDVRTQRLALEATTERLRQRVEMLRTEKLALAARYRSAKATVRAGEHVTGLSEEMSEIAQMVERARDRSRDVQARAAALAELSADALPLAAQRSDAARIEARLDALKGGSTLSLGGTANVAPVDLPE